MKPLLVGTISLASGVCAAEGTASAVFLGLQIREDKVLAPAANLPAGLRVFNFYAKFDGAGTASGPGKINTVLLVGQPDSTSEWGIDLGRNPGANFFQATAGQGASANNVGGPDLSVGNPRGLYDSWVSIGLKYQDSDNGVIDNSAGDTYYGFVNSDGVSGPASLGLGAGHDHVRGAWFTSNPPALQGAAQSVNGKYETFLAQIAVAGLAPGASVDLGNGNAALTWVNDIFTGTFNLFRQGDTSMGETAAVGYQITMTTLPAPGSAAVFGIAALMGARRRRAR